MFNIMNKNTQTLQRLLYAPPVTELCEFSLIVLANSNGMTVDEMTDVNGTWDI